MRPVPIQPSFTSLIGVGNREFLCGIERNDLGALGRKYHFFLDARCRDAVGGRAVGLDREHHAGLSSIGSRSEVRRETSGRSCSPRPRPWQKLRPKASISLAKPISFASGKARAILSLVIPGLSSSMARSIHSRAFLYAVRCAEVARPTLNVR